MRNTGGGPGRRSISEHESCPDLLRKALAEWCGGALVESCRRDLLDHIIALNERHLKRLLADYVGYYHDDRTHLGLGKGTPDRRIRSVPAGRILSYERLGGSIIVTIGRPDPDYLFSHPYI